MIEVLFDNRCGEEINDTVCNKIEHVICFTLLHQMFDKPTQVSVSFVTETEIRSLNHDFRNKDSITDVLSFPMEDEENEEGYILLGDIVLCIKRAHEQAIEYNHSFEREICYLSVHSTLHLLGYDHIDEEDKIVMREIEEEIMNELSILR